MTKVFSVWAVLVLMCGTLCGWLWQPARVGAAELSRVGHKIDDFSLRDYRGKTHSLGEFAESKLVVVAFLGTDCPLAKLYGRRLAELSRRFADRGVAFIGINANQQDSITEVADHARIHGIAFPVMKDLGNEVADRFGAVRTPEVFVLDADRVIRYWGRIDDQYGVGYQRPKPTNSDLVMALEELLEGRTVTQPEITAPGCFIGRVTKVDAKGDVTYSNQVARLLQRRCIECHRENEIAPFPLDRYEEVVGWAETIREVVDQGRMPPWFANPAYGHFRNDARLNEEEKQLLFTWLDNGCPEGDRSQLPPRAEFADGWRIPEPNLVLYMDDKPFKVQAEGVVDYQHFVVDPGFTEEKWLQAAEARPGNRSVVHHIVVFIQPPGADAGIAFGDRLASVYAPGTPPWEFPEGTAVPVPPGSKFVFQMHYTPNGSVQEDRSYLGLRFVDEKSVTRKARSYITGNFGINIPPGDDNYEATCRYKFRRDTLLLNLFPHMHLRGKDFRFEAEYPDGRREILLDVPNYDFAWQIRYDLVEPKLMPKGTKLHCIGHFDNSAENLDNPDPTARVTFGEQTWEEMFVGFFTAAPAGEDLGAQPDEAVAGSGN